MTRRVIGRAVYGQRVDRRMWTTAQLLSLNSLTRRATVSIDGGPAVSLPINGSDLDYAGFTTVNVLLDPTGGGAGQLVLGPAGVQGVFATPAPPPPDVPKTVTRTVLIRPGFTGTYSNKWGRYDAWYQSLGSALLWQGNAYGSGVLEGIATYQAQVKALGADSITKILLHVPVGHGSGTVQVQEVATGSLSPGNPAPSGSTASGALGGTIALGSTIRENLRTGTTRGLALVGSAYLAAAGQNKAAGMALEITYTKTA